MVYFTFILVLFDFLLDVLNNLFFLFLFDIFVKNFTHGNIFTIYIRADANHCIFTSLFDTIYHIDNKMETFVCEKNFFICFLYPCCSFGFALFFGHSSYNYFIFSFIEDCYKAKTFVCFNIFKTFVFFQPCRHCYDVFFCFIKFYEVDW